MQPRTSGCGGVCGLSGGWAGRGQARLGGIQSRDFLKGDLYDHRDPGLFGIRATVLTKRLKFSLTISQEGEKSQGRGDNPFPWPPEDFILQGGSLMPRMGSHGPSLHQETCRHLIYLFCLFHLIPCHLDPSKMSQGVIRLDLDYIRSVSSHNR